MIYVQILKRLPASSEEDTTRLFNNESPLA